MSSDGKQSGASNAAAAEEVDGEGNDISEALSKIFVQPSTLAGFDVETWRVVDAAEFRTSASAADLADEQIDAVLDDRIDLATFEELRRLEIACVRESGNEVLGGLTIVVDDRGVVYPTYSVTAGATPELDHQVFVDQATCQNRYTGLFELLYTLE